MAAAKPKLSEAAAKKSLTLHERRLDKARRERAFRYKKWHFYRYSSKRPAAERATLRTKWWKLYAEANHRVTTESNSVSKRRADCKWYAARKPKASSRDACVKHAMSFAGVKESPAGSNGGGLITTWQRRLGFGHVAWCGIFCGNMLLDAGVKGVSSQIASVALIYNMARSHSGCFRGWTRDTGQVRAGDLVILYGISTHVAMVRYVKNGVVYTVEGNTSSGSAGSQSNGGCVALRARPMSVVVGFALVDFPG